MGTGSRGTDVPKAHSTYLYAICVMAGRIAESTLARLPRGIEFGRPLSVHLPGNRTLVAAEVPATAFGTETPIAPRDMEWAARCAAAHHAVVQKLADRRGSTVVPLRPFTLFADAAAAAASLTANRKPLDAAFKRVSGRGEWVVRVTRPTPDTTPPAPRASAARATSGTAFLAARGAERRSSADRDQRVRDGAEVLAAGLTTVASSVTLRALEPGSGLVLDAVCLVPSKRRRGFRNAVTSLSRPLRADDCRVTVTGPWPAYSFVMIPDEGRG